MATSWKPASMAAFIVDYMSGMGDFDLAVKHKGTVDQIKRSIRFLREHEGLPAREAIKENPDYEYQGLREREEFSAFLIKARTRREIESKFGERTDILIQDSYPGLNLFTQINFFGEQVYILLPEIKDEAIKLQDRIWTYHLSHSDEGDFYQPYQMVQFPNELLEEYGEIIIAPIYDAHVGHYGHKREKLLSYIRWIAETPNVFSYVGGDFEENALDDGRGMTYGQDSPPRVQVERAVKLLAPIAHKMLFMLPGNHEWRTYKKAGIDPTEIIAHQLNIPYHSGPVYCSLLANGFRWKLYAFHGNTSSQTKGGKLNAAGRPRRFTDFIHFYVSGHTHDPLANNETCLVENPMLCRLDYLTQWTVACPSFMRWEQTYAYHAGWAPPGKGGVSLRLYPDGGYEAILRDRS